MEGARENWTRAKRQGFPDLLADLIWRDAFQEFATREPM